MNQDICVRVLALLGVLTSACVGIPISPAYNEMWRHPCGLSAVPPPPNLPPLTPGQRTDMVKSILTHFEEAMLRIGNLRNGYRNERVEGQTSTELCSFDFDLDNIFKHVPSFPDMNLVHENILDLCSEISAPLLTDYEKLTRVMIFLEQTIREEDYYSSGQFTPDLESMHDSIKQAMCLFHRLENQCVPSQSNRNSTDLVRNYEQTTTAKRYERDYLLIKDTHILLKGFWIKYNKCYELFTNSF